MKSKLTAFFILAFLCFPLKGQARENVDYWYIKDFQTQIIINKDSSLDITEEIIADTGSAWQHGIFRILPTKQYLDNRTIKSPISLQSITDRSDNKHPFATINNRLDGTLTWKIGDKDKLVTGENYYKISYNVKNAIRHGQKNDELYWNLTGNFWDIPIDSYRATIIFPDEINSSNAETNIYSGSLGEKNPLGAIFEASGNRIEVEYSKTLQPRQGITISTTFPDKIINPYVPTFLEKYGSYFYYIIPLLVLIACFRLWRKFGKDPKINPTIAPEFEIPEKLSPIEMGLVCSDGTLMTHYISASIINLAVNGYIKIKQLSQKSLLKPADYEIQKIKSGVSSPGERKLFEHLFATGDKVKLSSLKYKFYSNLADISKQSRNLLLNRKFLVPYSKTLAWIFGSVGAIVLILGLIFFVIDSTLAFSVILAAIILFIFTPLMSRRTLEGHKLYRRIQGFKLYMDKAEKYRQRYLEDEGLFEKLLPYAIMFAITTKWIKQMKNIYSQETFSGFHPAWYYGAGVANFNADQFSSAINEISSNMASSMASSPSSSGSGGGGFSGGGGGGGGGGGW